MKFEMNNQFKNNLSNLSTNVSIKDLLTSDFLKQYTNFSTLEEFDSHSGIDWENIDDTKLDAFVSANTQFNSWQELITQAGTLWVANQLKR